MKRRDFLSTSLGFALLSATQFPAIAVTRQSPAERLAELEHSAGGRLGVSALNTNNQFEISYRADERFPFCSTFKLLIAGAVLALSDKQAGLLEQPVPLNPSELVGYSPITEKHLGQSMKVADLCAATVQYSDNLAANTLLRLLGGLNALNEFTRSIGDHVFRLDRWEVELNSAIPGDERDTTSPKAMRSSLMALTYGDALSPQKRELLQQWLKGNTTGDHRIRAGVPAGWQLGDKTGSGDYGTTNDVAVIWPPKQKPIFLAIYYTQDQPKAKWKDEVIALATKIVVDAFMDTHTLQQTSG